MKERREKKVSYLVVETGCYSESYTKSHVSWDKQRNKNKKSLDPGLGLNCKVRQEDISVCDFFSRYLLSREANKEIGPEDTKEGEHDWLTPWDFCVSYCWFCCIIKSLSLHRHQRRDPDEREVARTSRILFSLFLYWQTFFLFILFRPLEASFSNSSEWRGWLISFFFFSYTSHCIISLTLSPQ